MKCLYGNIDIKEFNKNIKTYFQKCEFGSVVKITLPFSHAVPEEFKRRREANISRSQWLRPNAL